MNHLHCASVDEITAHAKQNDYRQQAFCSLAVVFPPGKAKSWVETRIGTGEGGESSDRLPVGNRLMPLGEEPPKCPTALHRAARVLSCQLF